MEYYNPYKKRKKELKFIDSFIDTSGETIPVFVIDERMSFFPSHPIYSIEPPFEPLFRWITNDMFNDDEFEEGTVLNIKRGTGVSQRVGKEIIVRKLIARFTITSTPSQFLNAVDEVVGGDCVRLLVILDKQNNNYAIPILDEIFTSYDVLGTDFHSLRNRSFMDKYEILYDEVKKLNTNTTTQENFYPEPVPEDIGVELTVGGKLACNGSITTNTNPIPFTFFTETLDPIRTASATIAPNGFFGTINKPVSGGEILTATVPPSFKLISSQTNPLSTGTLENANGPLLVVNDSFSSAINITEVGGGITEFLTKIPLASIIGEIGTPITGINSSSNVDGVQIVPTEMTITGNLHTFKDPHTEIINRTVSKTLFFNIDLDLSIPVGYTSNSTTGSGLEICSSNIFFAVATVHGFAELKGTIRVLYDD